MLAHLVTASPGLLLQSVEAAPQPLGFSAEPFATALLLTTFGLLLGVSILFSRASSRFGIPIALVFLGIGILAGSEGIGGIPFEDYAFAFRLGTVALVLILFDGGLNTSLAAVKLSVRPASLLATAGVLGTAGVVAAGANVLGFTWPEALLLGAVVSSTDAAAVFAALRGSGIHLRRRVGVTLEVESGLNDPMAVMLTVMLTENLLAPGEIVIWRAMLDVLIEMVVGGVLGYGIGYGGRELLSRLRLPVGGLYPALMLTLAFLSFGVSTLLHGSGFLAVYVAALVLGNGALPYKGGILRVHDALAWLSQIAMFLVLGLLVFPSRLPDVALTGLALAIFLAVIARPIIVAACLVPFGYTTREIALIGWAGLRGAVPIILATFPVLAGAPGATRIFDTVFFIVVANAIIPGGTVPWVTRKLGLESRDPPAPAAVLEVESIRPLRGRLASFYIDEVLAVAGVPLAELPFPEGAAMTMIVRGEDIIAPKGNTVMEPGDHVYVLMRPEDEPTILLMFGRPEGS
jgi:cell volume regulation protein A